MIELSKSPLVTFILVGYNQESFIREAISAAFTQTYSPLEIILSDDHSSDHTFELMRQAADAYEGPHQVVLNKTESNLGLAGNLNQCLELSRGGLIVVAAGDDVSCPDRTTKLVQRLLSTEEPVDMVCSYFEEIDEKSRPTGFVKEHVMFVPDMAMPVLNWKCGATGACVAYNRILFDKYGPLDRRVISEDWVFAFRAWLENGIALVKEPLVKHRTHSESISVMTRQLSKLPNRDDRYRRRRKLQAGSLGIAEEWLKAWRNARPGDSTKIEGDLEELVQLRRAQYEAFEASPFQVVRMAWKVQQLGGGIMALKMLVRHVFGVY